MSQLPTTMNYKQYAEFVTRLGSKYSMGSFEAKAGTMGLGIAGEIGEVAMLADTIDMQQNVHEEYRLKLIDELGDLMWYIVFGLANVLELRGDGWPAESLSDPRTRTFSDFSIDEPHDAPVNSVEMMGIHYMDLAKKCGFLCDTTKKLLYHGIKFDDAIKEKLYMILKRIMGCITIMACNVCGVTLQAIVDRNVEKLSARYKSLEFSTEAFLAKENAKEE